MFTSPRGLQGRPPRSTWFALGLCAFSVAAQAEGVYRLELITDGQQSLQVTDLNDRAEVVGLRVVSDVVRGFVWRDGEIIADVGQDARAINARGDVVGAALGEPLRGYLRLRDGTLIDIAPVPNVSNIAIDVNNHRQVIGAAASTAFLWERGEVTFLDPLPDEEAFAFPVVINNGGVIAGISIAGGESRAVIWVNGTVMALTGLEGSDRQQPIDMNDRGQILVEARFPTRGVTLLWDEGQVSELPLVYPDQNAYTASSINNASDIVGTTFNTNIGTSVATLWRRGTTAIDLNTLIRTDDPLQPFVTLVAALQINNTGEIVAQGIDSRSPGTIQPYLLTRR